MREAFEAKKHAYRQTQDGIVVSFVIHPQEIPEHLALAALGARFVVAVAEIGDDEKPKEGLILTKDAVVSESAKLVEQSGRKFSDLPLSQQCGIRCNDLEFQLFLSAEYRSTAADYPDAASFVRNFCNILSRSELDRPGKPALDWADLETKFQAWRTDNRFAGARHG